MNRFPIYGGLASQRFYPFPAYSLANGWQLKGRLVGESASVAIDAQYFTDDGSGTWTLDWPGAQTAALATGDYIIMLIADNGSGTELPVGQEDVRVFASDATDLRSDTKKTLDALKAMRDGKASRDEMSMSYNGRSISRLSWQELNDAIDRLERAYSREQNAAAGGGKVKTVNYRF